MASAEDALQSVQVLVVDADPAFRRLVRSETQGIFDVVEAERFDAADGDFDAVVLCVEGDPIKVAEAIGAAAGRAPVVAVSGCGSLSLAVAAMRAGAVDFLVKPVRAGTVAESLSRALRRESDRPAAAERPSGGFEGFIGRSREMRGVFDQIARIAPSRAPVFVTGESGTGKELAAGAIHARSGRTGAFVAINCGAIPRDLMESELFGHVRGAFTGAHDDRPGAAELSGGGTLFLDEICEMEPGLQTKLLRFVQTGTLRRLGDARARAVDVRIICATNREPASEVAAGRFREDLFYRLHVLPVHLPPLRERSGDILPLADSFLAQFSAEEGRRFAGFDARARALMLNYEWPGNVRQLQNVVRRVVVMNDGEAVTADMLALALAHAGWPGAGCEAERPGDPPVAVEPFWLQEKRIIERALDAFEGNVGRAAAALEISPSTIYRKKQAWETGSAA